MAHRITVVTSGQLSTSPRMLKAADALAAEGYAVRVVSTRFMDWATAADDDVRATRGWDWDVVDYHPVSGRGLYWKSGLRNRAARALARRFGPDRLPFAWAARAGSRVYDELAGRIAAAPADLVYGGTTGGLAPIAAAARRLGVPYALDLEDLHSAERPADEPEGELSNALSAQVERRVLAGAAFRTAGSAAIAGAYRQAYGLDFLPVGNTFPLPGAPEIAPGRAGELRLVWFSQTIGPGRGLEQAVRALGEAGLAGGIHLIGRPAAGYVESLEALAAAVAPRIEVTTCPPVPPDAVLDTCRGFDVGLGLEPGFSPTNALALSNKVLTYPLAGLAVALTITPGQVDFARDLGEGALAVAAGDVAALAAGFARWAADPALLARAKARAFEAAKRRWHWEHPLERGVLLAAVGRVLGER